MGTKAIRYNITGLAACIHGAIAIIFVSMYVREKLQDEERRPIHGEI
jgi:hypothetical protein